MPLLRVPTFPFSWHSLVVCLPSHLIVRHHTRWICHLNGSASSPVYRKNIKHLPPPDSCISTTVMLHSLNMSPGCPPLRINIHDTCTIVLPYCPMCPLQSTTMGTLIKCNSPVRGFFVLWVNKYRYCGSSSSLSHSIKLLSVSLWLWQEGSRRRETSKESFSALNT